MTVTGGRLTGGDQDLDFTGMVALDHHGNLGLITGRGIHLGTWYWKGVGITWGTPWRWTAARPLIVCESLREYVEHTDDQLGL